MSENETGSQDGDSVVDSLFDELQEAVDDGITRAEVEEEVQRWKNFDVAGSELERAVRNEFADRYDVELESGGGNGVTPFSEMEEGEWYTVEATVVKLFDESELHESISQKGYIDDGEDRIVFTVFESSEDVPLLNEGWSYRFDSVPCDMFNGNPQVNITSTTTVTHLEEEIEPSDQTVDIVAPIVGFAEGGTGIYAVDPDTGEKVKPSDIENPEHRLRVMPMVDTGETCWTVSMKGDIAEEFVGMSTEEALSVVRERISEESPIYTDLQENHIGEYFRVAGDKVGGDTISATSFSRPGELSVNPDEYLTELRSFDPNQAVNSSDTSQVSEETDSQANDSQTAEENGGEF